MFDFCWHTQYFYWLSSSWGSPRTWWDDDSGSLWPARFFSSIGDSKPLQVLYVPRAPNDLYFWRSTPSKTSPFPTKTGAVNCPTTCRLHLSFLRWNNPYNLLLTIRYPAWHLSQYHKTLGKAGTMPSRQKIIVAVLVTVRASLRWFCFLSACLVSILINCVSLFSEISFWDPF